MRVLLIKTSSLGDIIHTFPAITDATTHHSSLIFDWLVEENFSEIPPLHPAIGKVFPVALRRWRKNFWSLGTWKEIQKISQELHLENYEIVLDAQGLIKSSILGLLTKGQRYGYAWKGAREPLSSLLYHHKFEISRGIPAIQRTRLLFAKAFGYPLPVDLPHANLSLGRRTQPNQKTILFLPGTSWVNKKWPTAFWIELAHLIKSLNVNITVPWLTDKEYQEALQIQTAGSHVQVLDKMSLGQLALRIQNHCLTVSGDSGIGYLSAAFQIPTLMLWGPTTPKAIGQLSLFQHDLKATLECAPCLRRHCRNQHLSPLYPPCFSEITSQRVFESIKLHLNSL